MSATKLLLELTEDREEAVVRLAEMAGILRGVRTAGAAEPVLCLLDCDSHHWATFGPNTLCTNCHTRPLPAGTWHGLLVLALRAHLARAPWPALAA